MDDSVQNLLVRRNDIESRIQDEKNRLKSLKEELQNYMNTYEMHMREKDSEEKKESEIELYRDKENQLIAEYQRLQKEIKDLNNEEINILAPELEKKKRANTQISAEQEALTSEIQAIEKQMQATRDHNIRLEEEYNGKLHECRMSYESNSREQQIGMIRKQEEDARIALEKSKVNLMRMKDKMQHLETCLFSTQNECIEEERKILHNEHQYLSELDHQVMRNNSQKKSLEDKISSCKMQLAKLRDILMQYEKYKEENATPESIMKTEQMEMNKNKIQELTKEFKDFYQAIVDIRRDKIDYYERFKKINDTALRKIKAEHHEVQDQIDSLQSDIDKMKRDNEDLRDHYEKELQDCIFQANTGQRDIGRLRLEEQEARVTVQKLQENVKKLNEQILILEKVLISVQDECFKAERKANQMNLELMEAKAIEQQRIKMEIEENRLNMEIMKQYAEK